MFPSQGYFCTINCPDFVNGKCNRVYCHFSHNEKLQKYKQNKFHSSTSSGLICDNFALEKLPPGKFDEIQKNESSQIFRSSTDILKNKIQNASAQSGNTSEASTSNTSEKATSEILTHMIGEAVKKVLCENSTLNSISLDPNSFIKSLDANIVTKAAQEISAVHLQKAPEKKQPKLYLPPPGTPSYKPTPISELNNKYNKQKDPKLNFEVVEEYTPTPISCKDKDENEEVTDFSSDEDNDVNAKSDFDMLEEVLVEKLSSDPARNKAIQKRKKALRKLSSHISSKPSTSNSKNVQEKSHIESFIPQAVFSDSLSNSDSVFDPPSPIFTSSADTSVSYSLEQNSIKSTIDSPVSTDVSHLSEIKDSKFSTNKVDKASISSTHNLLPQIAELARPNVKSWTPVAKVDSIFSVEKMLEQLDRVESMDKNPLQKHNVNLSLLDTKTTQNATETQGTLNLKEKESNLDNLSESNEFNISSKADELNHESINTKNSTRDTDNSLKDKRENSTDERTKISSEVNFQERHSRKRSFNSDSSSDKCKRKRSSSSSRKKKRHKRRYSSMDDSSESEDYSDNRRDSSEDRHSRKRKKHRKHKGRKAKDYKKRNKRDRSRSRKKRRSREKKHFDSSESQETSDSDHIKHPESKNSSEDKNSPLLAPHQIKQEKIEVDLSIVKVENAKDIVSRKDKELKKNITPKPLENRETDKLSAPSEVKTVVQDKPNSESIPKSVQLVKENVLKNSTGNDKKIINSQSQKSDAKNSLTKENITKSSEYKNLNSKTVQSSNSSKQIKGNPNSVNVQTENSLIQKSGAAISSRNKLENYTSSLLAKVSDSALDVLRPRTNSSESSSSTSVKQDISNSSLSSSEINQKDSKHTQDITSNNKNSSDIISSPKSKCLKEFSIFEGLKEISDSKCPPKLSSNNKSSKKPEGKNVSEKNSRGRTSQSGHESETKRSKNKEKEMNKSKEKEKEMNKIKEKERIKSKEKERSKSTEKGKERSKSREKERERYKRSSSTKGSSSHSSQKEKDNNKERHHSRESSSKSTKDKDSKGNKSSSHSSSRYKESSSHSRSKDSKDFKRSGSNKYEKDSSSQLKEKKVVEKKQKSHLSPSDASPTGTDSPIPDLSALDEIPKEDWDQLLSSSNEKIDNSDSDEGIDISQNYPVDEDLLEDEEEDINDPRVLEECMKVFSEYDPSENLASTVPKKVVKIFFEPSKDENVTEDIVVPTKRNRVAYSGAAGNLIAKPKPLVKPHRKTPAEIMLERYKKLKEEEVQLQKKLEIQRKELAKHGRFPPSGLAISSSSVSSTSDPSPSSQTAVSSTSGKKRIAIAPKNVSALLKSKELLKTMPTNSSNKILVSTTSATAKSTPAMSHAKGAKRIAHTPNLETIERPVISTEDGTKVPQNIRQRYLNCFIDETLKFCDGDSHAYNVALAEESICHKRATTRMVYLNLAVNILKKLRACQISEAAQELLLNDPKYKDTRESKIVSQPVVSSSSQSSSSSVSKKKFIHPVNPNHRTVSHYSVMASGGQKGTWSIQKSKKSLPENINDYLTDTVIGVQYYIKLINGAYQLSAPLVYTTGEELTSLRGIGGLESKYSCCHGDSQSEGCCLGTTHVSENFSPDSLTSYVRTIPKCPNSDGDYGVYALDCEMCYTTAGSELTRVTVVDTNCKSVYETLVKPENPIIDYNTRYKSKHSRDCARVKLRIFEPNFVPHSLGMFIFFSLQIIHDTVVDTSVVFPHKLGAPFKRALRNLASEYLSKIIQNDEGGHDSAEDANTCMELMKWKVKEDLKGQF
ncbi:RNA exonuclease 1-like protein [Armadillidium nasatum]|uniref:RNA exonuclease 1-like protein n=1 Tax=Armadillidium nasatum TaxID=96803 RepID=A0A5N5TPS6_9CRUS|nr:RNA exonuclease 1-like protein [Armadillidium nasatum]